MESRGYSRKKKLEFIVLLPTLALIQAITKTNGTIFFLLLTYLGFSLEVAFLFKAVLEVDFQMIFISVNNNF